MNPSEFRALLQRLADAWSNLDTETAVACFTTDAVYMEPPSEQLFVGHAQLRPYFAALEPGTFMRWTGVWFDETSQTGAGEFVFGDEGDALADHGVAVIDIEDGLIARWREYLQKGPADQDAFLTVDGKEWTWHIGRYSD